METSFTFFTDDSRILDLIVRAFQILRSVPSDNELEGGPKSGTEFMGSAVSTHGSTTAGNPSIDAEINNELLATSVNEERYAYSYPYAYLYIY